MKHEPTGILIPTAGLKDGIYEFSFDIPGSEVRLPENFTESVKVAVRMEKLRQRYILSLGAQTEGHYPCDRCLEDLLLPVDVSFDILCTTDMNEVRQLGEEEEVKYLDPNEHRIDLTEDLRQYLLLNVPLKKICGEAADGTPLCRNYTPPVPVEEEPREDPRWAGLKGIRLDDENEK